MTPRDGLPPEPGDEAPAASRPGQRPASDPQPRPREQREPQSPGSRAPGDDGSAAGHGSLPQAGWLPQAADALFGDGAEAEEAYGLLTVDVPAANWVPALTVARDELGCTYFDWLSAVDEAGAGFRVCAHLVALPTESAGIRRLIVRTTVPHDAATLPTATGVYAGAAWHERETHEMFGLDFTGHPGLDPLLLPDGFEGHPLRKDFVLAARVVKAWPGAKEPGESGHGGARRRQMRPPGVPDPNEWGPQAGQAPAADEPRPRPRRARSASAGSASQRTEAVGGQEPGRPGPAGPRRARSAGGGSAGQRAETTESGAGGAEATAPSAGRLRPRSAGEGPTSRRAEESAAPEREAAAPPEERRASGPRRGEAPTETGEEAGPRSADAPWHHARPAFDDWERDGDEEGEA